MPGPNPETASILSHQGSTFSRAGTLNALRGNAPAFSLDTFSSKDFIVKDFVEALSETTTNSTRRSGAQTNTNANPAAASNQPFDPKPLIRTFEHALGRLKTLSEDLEERENELSGSVRRAEGQHNGNIKSRERELEKAMSSFQQLERTLDGESSGDGGGNAAVRIGERLEELDRQRQRAQDAKFVLQCWLEVSEKGDLGSLEDVRRRGGNEGKVRCAHIARQLLKIAVRLEGGGEGKGANGVHFANGVNGNNGGHSPNGSFRGKQNGGQEPREIIEKFLEMLEKDLLRSFDDFYRRQNFDGMRECATALRDFSDGNSVISLFVNQHQLFIDTAQLATEDLATDTQTWDRLADPDTEPPGVEPSLQNLLDEVKVVVQEESFIIKRAFPFYEEVLSRFLQRVFQQSVQQRLEMVLNKADSISSLAFLRSLQASRSYINTLVEDLKAHGLTEHPEPASAVISSQLDQQLDVLFVPYFTGSSYIEREKRNLGELFEGLLFKFTIYHANRKKLSQQSSTYLGSLSARSKEWVSNARETYMDRLDRADLPASQRSMLLRIAGLHGDSAHPNYPSSNAEVTDEDGQLQLANTKRMLKWLAEGVGRGLELAGGNEAPKEIRELLHLLLSNMGETYLETALDAANDASLSAESHTKSEPDLTYLSDLRSAISVLHLMLTTIELLLLPLASPNVTVSRDLQKTVSSFLDRVETRVDTILHRTLDTASTWTARLLANQKKTDFRPRDDANLQLDSLQTPTCQTVCTFLARLHSRAAQSLSGRVLASFSLELALSLRSLLLTHFKSYTVSLTGALVVSKDIGKYIELLRGWGLPDSFNPGLEVLTEIANIFVIGPEALRERLRKFSMGGEGGLVGVTGADLRGYVMKREDSGSVGVVAVLNGL